MKVRQVRGLTQACLCAVLRAPLGLSGRDVHHPLLVKGRQHASEQLQKPHQHTLQRTHQVHTHTVQLPAMLSHRTCWSEPVRRRVAG